MKHTLLVGAIASLIGLGVTTGAQAAVQRGQATLAWLTIPANARDAAMGNTAVFNDEDASAAFQNPAGLGRIQRGNAYFMYTTWLADMTVMDLAVAYRLPNIGTFAVTARSMDYGDFNFTQLATNPDGYIDLTSADVGTVGGFLVGLAYGRKLTDKFSVGGQIKYASDRLGKFDVVDRMGRLTPNSQATVSGMLLDFGTNYNTGWRSINLSMAIQNFGTQKGASNGREEFTAPLIFKVGVAADVLEFAGIEDAPLSLLVRAEGTDPRDAREGLNVGGELKYRVGGGLFAAARGGMVTRQHDGGMTFGFGLGGMVGQVQGKVDYAYSDYGSILGGVNRIGVSVSF